MGRIWYVLNIKCIYVHFIWRIDGTYSKQIGKYVNDAEEKTVENNSAMKLLVVDGNPHLALFSTRKICKDEEICYDYGEKNLEWRKVTLTNHFTIFMIA